MGRVRDPAPSASRGPTITGPYLRVLCPPTFLSCLAALSGRATPNQAVRGTLGPSLAYRTPQNADQTRTRRGGRTRTDVLRIMNPCWCHLQSLRISRVSHPAPARVEHRAMSSPIHRDLGGADRFRFSTPILGLPALLGSNQEPAVLETAALPIAPRAIVTTDHDVLPSELRFRLSRGETTPGSARISVLHDRSWRLRIWTPRSSRIFAMRARLPPPRLDSPTCAGTQPPGPGLRHLRFCRGKRRAKLLAAREPSPIAACCSPRCTRGRLPS